MPRNETFSPWSRRALLAMLARGALTGAALAWGAGCSRPGPGTDPDAACLTALRDAGIVPDHGEASRLGQLYRDRHPDEGSAAAICRGLGAGSAPATPRAWRQRIAGQLRNDLAANRQLELDGWTMTLTEARLLALASLR